MSQLKQSLKLPGASKIRGKTPADPSSPPSNTKPITSIDAKVLESVLAKGSSFVDLSTPAYNLESDDFLLHCPNVIKELDLSFNSLVQLNSLKNLNKLKRLFVDNNEALVSMQFQGLTNLVLLSAINNRIVAIEDTTDLKKLVHLDLCGNRIVHGFDELGKLKALRVLDLASNTIDQPIQNFTAYVLEPLKRLPKLEYLSFIDNPIETKIPEFRSFIIQELPKLKYLDWLPITKEEKTKAAKLESDGIWAAKSLPPTATPSPRVGAVTGHNVNYNKDILEAVQNSEASGGNSLPAEKKASTNEATELPAASATASVEKPTSVSNFRGMTTSASTPSPVQRRAAPVRESSQFNDFSALDAMIEEFEGASHELGLSRSISSPGNTSTSSTKEYRPSHSTQNSIGNISDISPPVAASVKSSAQEDPLADLLTEFESITPVPSSHNVSSATPMRGAGANYDAVVSPIQHPTNEQFNEALASTDVHYPDNSYEKYAEDAQILSNIDKAIEATPGADKNRQKKFATNVVRSDFPDAYFADELEAALSELEASLDFPEMESTQDHHKSNANGSTAGSAAASQNNTRTEFNLTSISEIESTLQELASTTSTPSKSDISADNNYSSPYSTPTHNNNNLNTSRSSPYTTFSSSSNRTNTPLPNQAKPTVQRTQSDSKAAPKINTPTSPLKKPAPPKLTPPSNNSSFSHSFAAAFDPSSPVSPTATTLAPDSPKIRSKPGQDPVVEQPQANEEDVLDDLINSLALETPVQEEPQVPTMLRARRPQSAMFVQPIYQPQLATLPPAQPPPSIQQQQALLQQQERDRKLHEEKERRMQEEHEQQQLAMKRQLELQQQQMEQLQQQQQLRERTLQQERERERLHREQLAQREQLLQRELLQQKELQFQKEMHLQTELRKKEMQAEALLQQQKQQAQLMQQQALVQQQQQEELAIRKIQQTEQRDRLVNTTGQIVPYNYLTITDKLGAGSFGDVHTCVMRYPPTANLAPKDVTVKKIRMQRFNDNFLEQFSKEVQSFSSLSQHPHISPLIGGCVEVVICTIHDYVSGVSLAETKGISELGSNLVLQIARSIVSGLQELHRIGKMHRSLKPSNVMLANPDEANPLRTVKLRDYGFASIKDAILKAGQAPSPYLAPEILTSGSPPTYNQAVDTYSFGMTLWYMFSGEQPFLGLHPKKMAESVSTGVRPNIPPHTPVALAKLIAACWNTDPGSRPPLDTVARILSMSEAKLFAGAAPTANPSIQPPEPVQSQPPPPQPTHTQPVTPPVIQQPTQPTQQQRAPQQEAAQGNRIGTVLSRVVDTLISKSANQVPKACRLLEVINQPEVIPVMIEKAIPGYLVDMLKNNQLDSTDIEAILRTLLILSDHEIFAQAISAPDMIAPILALVRPHTAVTTVSRSSYVVKNTYVLPAARVVHAVIAHPRLLIALRDRPEMETLIAFTDSLKDIQNHAINQSNDDTAVHILGVINQLLTTPKSRAYFVSTSGLDAALYHANSSYAPLRAQAVEVAFLFAVNLPSPPNVYQDSFARNPAAVIGLISCISSTNDAAQLRGHAAKVLNMLAQLSWQAPTGPLGGGSRISGSSRLGGTHAAVTASLQAAVPRLISTLGNCRAGDNDELVVDICRAISSILDNPNLNASASISKLDQLAIFAQLQNIPQTSPILQPILFLANHIAHLRDDTANLHGELAMCVPQLISIAFSPSSLPDVQSQALDFIAHISTDGQHAATLVEAGVVRSAMHQLTSADSKSDATSAFSFQILASVLAALFQSQSPSFSEVCASIVASGGIGLIAGLVKSGSSSQSDVCEWAVATLSELARDETTREAIVSSGTLALLGAVSKSPASSTRIVEGSLACFSSFCPFPKYYPTLRDSQAIAAIAARLSSGDNLVALSLKCVLQLVKEQSGRELLIAHNVPSLLEALASSQSGNPTLPLAAKRVLGLLKA